MKIKKKDKELFIWSSILVLFIVFGLVYTEIRDSKEYSFNNLFRQKSIEIEKLELLEERVINSISNNEFTKADLDLSRLIWSYDDDEKMIEFWDLKRKVLKEKLDKYMMSQLKEEDKKSLSKHSYTKDNVAEKDKKNNLIEKSNTSNTSIVNINTMYLGLYIFQSSDGSTQFYKFIKDPEKKVVNILYQDNLSGEIKIENYKLENFNDSSGEAVLQNKKDTKDTKKIFFRKDPESDNGFKLMDSKGVVYTFVSN